MLSRGLVSRIMFPYPNPPTYNVDSFPHDLIWVPKTAGAKFEESVGCPPIEDCVPCLLLTYPSARFLILFFHANAEDLGRCHGFCCYIRDQFQVHVLAVEYPGYGICPGVPCSQSIMDNALAAMSFVTETLQWPLDSIKVFGRSIGTGPAVGLASTYNIAGAIFVTPFISVQELFADRVGTLSRLFIDDREWFNNFEKMHKITSPTMIIHGQRDELIACRHGESLYEALRPRKLLISPPDMEHNTNLLINLQFFVLPMFQFFALPDYAFQDLQVPPWAYDKRRSPFYVRPGVEISSHQLPSTTGKRMSIPAGDNGVTPISVGDPNRKADAAIVAKVNKASERITGSKARSNRALAPLFSAQGSQDSISDDSKPSGNMLSTNGATRTLDLDEAIREEQEKIAEKSTSRPRQVPSGGYGIRNGGKNVSQKPPLVNDNVTIMRITPEAREAIQRLEDFAGKICANEICSDELCVMEERMDNDGERGRQEKALENLINARRAQNNGATPEDGLPNPPRLVANRLSCGSQSVWPTWCSKARDEDPAEMNVQTLSWKAPPPGLPPNEVGDVDLPEPVDPMVTKAAAPVQKSDSEQAFTDDCACEGWGTGPPPSTPLPVESPPVSPWASQPVGMTVTRLAPKGIYTGDSQGGSNRSRGQINSNATKVPIWAACCRALPSDPLLDRQSPMRRPPSALNEEDPVMSGAPFGGRVISGSHRPNPPEEQNWRKYPLGTSPMKIFPDAKDEVLPPAADARFQKGTKFAI